MEVGDLIRDWLRGYMGLFLGLDTDGKYVKVLWLDGKTGWINLRDAKVIQ
tara:strand:- start:1047 stop:1196 length:150 start_codon:yes stop_codon:yes gene_type:complete